MTSSPHRIFYGLLQTSSIKSSMPSLEPFDTVARNRDAEKLEEDNDGLEEREIGVEYFDKFPTRSELAYHRPFDELSKMTYDSSLGIVKFTNGADEIAYMMPHKIEQFKTLSNMEKEHKQSIYFRSEEDKGRGLGAYAKAVEVFDPLSSLCIWEAFGGNTRTLDSIREETRQDCNFTRRHSRFGSQIVETASEFTVTTSKYSRDDFRIHIDDVKVTDSKKPEEDSTG
ncbi:hypothetical protein Tco_0067132 [Tanacetum coccineum]